MIMLSSWYSTSYLFEIRSKSFLISYTTTNLKCSFFSLQQALQLECCQRITSWWFVNKKCMAWTCSKFEKFMGIVYDFGPFGSPNLLGIMVVFGLPGGSVMKNPLANAGDVGLIPGWGRSPGGGNSNTPVFLPRESLGQRSLADYSSWGHKESDTTEHACMIELNMLILKI